MTCRLCGNEIKDGETAILGVCKTDIGNLVLGAVKDKERKEKAAKEASAEPAAEPAAEETPHKPTKKSA